MIPKRPRQSVSTSPFPSSWCRRSGLPKSPGLRRGRQERFDYEYQLQRWTRNLFMICEPLAGWTSPRGSQQLPTSVPWNQLQPHQMRWLADAAYPEVEKVAGGPSPTNLNTHRSRLPVRGLRARGRHRRVIRTAGVSLYSQAWKLARTWQRSEFSVLHANHMFESPAIEDPPPMSLKRRRYRRLRETRTKSGWGNYRVEVHGGQHQQNLDYDQRRSRCLQQLGFKVLRFWNNEVLTTPQTVAEAVYNELTAKE